MYRVVIVEDEILVRVGLRSSINWVDLEMEVIAALSNGAEAWDIYEKERPDIIITDIKMPIMDGIQLIEKIRKTDHSTKIIILSCVEEFDLVRKAISLGVMDYMLKLTMMPDQMEQVLLKIKEQLDQQQKHLPMNPSINEQVWLETIIKDFMFRDLYSTEDFAALIKLTDRLITDQKLLIMIIEVDHFRILQERFDDEKGDLIKASLLNVLNEVLMMYNRGRVINLEPWRYMLILSLGDLHSEQKMQQIISEMCNQIQKVMRTFFNVTVTLGVSPIRSGFQHIKKQYEESMEVIALKYVLGGGRLLRRIDIHLEQVQGIVREQLKLLSQHCAKFGHVGFQQQVESKIDGYLKRKHLPDRNHLNVLFAQLLQLPIAFFALSGEAIDQIAFAAQIRIASCETLVEAVLEFNHVVDQFAQQYESDNVYSKAVSTSLDYIQHHYQENPSLSELAELVSMSPNYLGALFKKETGLSIVDYMNGCKINKSKELIETTNMKTYEIATQVGFADHSYYSRIFRKEVGCNPKDYRKQLSDLKSGDAVIE